MNDNETDFPVIPAHLAGRPRKHHSKRTEGLEYAIKVFGTQKNLAKALTERGYPCKPQTISLWRTKGVPARRAKQIEEVSNGRVPRKMLCPEIFG